MSTYKDKKSLAKHFCRSCGSKTSNVLRLGDLPIANELSKKTIDMDSVELFSLELHVCLNCGLGQIPDLVSRERLFEDYRYMSSVSTEWLSHCKEFSDEVMKELDINSSDLVLEIASNDGYLLKNFLEKQIQVLGIEPARNIAQIARDNGIETISQFFGVEVAQKVVAEKGYPRLVIANNVAAHVPDILDFFKGLRLLCDKKTLITIENPNILNLIHKNQYDTIYHEHYSYLSANSIDYLAKKVGLNLIKVDDLNTHGGSNRYWLSTESPSKIQSNVLENKMLMEVSLGLKDIEIWQEFAVTAMSHFQKIKNWFEEKENKAT